VPRPRVRIWMLLITVVVGVLIWALTMRIFFPYPPLPRDFGIDWDDLVGNR
jgi:hypothetical protein